MVAGGPTRRLVVLGASNVARGLNTLTRLARHAWNEPLDMLIATGHGRSYGLRSQVLVRTLPGIATCGLWHALEERAPLPTVALVTDIGNDVAYHVSVDQIVAWVEACVARLLRQRTEIVLTGLPIASLRDLDAARYYFFRALLMPRCRLSLSEMIHRAEQLDAALEKLALRHAISFARPERSWFGVDPIHLRRRQWSTAWGAYLSRFSGAKTTLSRVRVSPLEWLRWRFLVPDERTIFGLAQRGVQPQWRGADASALSLY